MSKQNLVFKVIFFSIILFFQNSHAKSKCEGLFKALPITAKVTKTDSVEQTQKLTKAFNILKRLLEVRYDIKPSGLEEILAKGAKGLIIAPNHPAFMDPVIMATVLYLNGIYVRPLISEKVALSPGVKQIVSLLNPILVPEPNTRRGQIRLKQINKEIAEGLSRGENFLIYPAGHLQHTDVVQFFGKSMIPEVLKENPQARVVLAKIGLWGSSFGYGKTGERPTLWQMLNSLLIKPFLNLVVFTPKREVPIVFSEPNDLPKSGTAQEIQSYFDRFFNTNAPQAELVSYGWFDPNPTHKVSRRVPERPADNPANKKSPNDVDQSIKDEVVNFLLKVSPALKAEDLKDFNSALVEDLALDSLAMTQVVGLLLQQEINDHNIRTLGDVILAKADLISQGPQRPEKDLIPLKPWKEVHGRGTGTTLALAPGENLWTAFLEKARTNFNQVIFVDTALNEVLRYRDIITRVYLLKPEFEKMPGQRIGVMIPAGAGAFITWAAITAAGKTPVFLNFKAGERNVLHAVKSLGIESVFTSEKVLDKLDADGLSLKALEDHGLVRYAEDVRSSFTTKKKLGALMVTWLGKLSRSGWASLYDVNVKPDSISSIILTSGSEGFPKAVPLTHENQLENIKETIHYIPLYDTDSFLAFLPPFHSFGLMGTTLMNALVGVPTVYTPDPLDSKQLARIAKAYRPTLMATTPTFYNNMASQGLMDSFDLIVAGAEKVTDKFFANVQQSSPNAKARGGYGISETSPVIAVNPRHTEDFIPAGEIDPSRYRSAYLILQNIKYRIVDPATLNELNPGEKGLLLVSGPSIFKGYLGDNVKNPFVTIEDKNHVRTTWYNTGDLVTEIAPRWIIVNGRLKRAPKIGGEMIPLDEIENSIIQHLTSPSAAKPEFAIDIIESGPQNQIVLFTTRADIDLSTVRKTVITNLNQAIYQPSQIVYVKEIPLLATGKVNYPALKELLQNQK